MLIKTHLPIVLIIILLYSNAVSDVMTEEYIKYEPHRAYTEQLIWDIADIPEEILDIGLWALIIAKEYDSSVNVENYLKQLDGMTAEINRMIAGRPEDISKFLMTLMFICDSGLWNQNYPFSYNLDDPLGKEPETKLLSSLIDTRKGNCLSLPTIFLSLMERVDPNIPFHAVKTPSHMFCRFHDRQDGKIWNVETTRKGVANRDEYYINTQKINQTSLDSCLYLCDLSKREFLADLITILISKHRTIGEYKMALKYAELALKLNSRSETALVQKGALLAWLGYNLREDILARQQKPNQEELDKLTLYEKESILYINRAISMGWEQWSPEDQERYLKFIKETKKMLNQ